MDTSVLYDFSRGLVSLIGKPTDLRPFVCEGSPLACDAFLVGFNPASPMSVDFWDFWSDSNGFDKYAWIKKYKEERRNRPLKPGRTRRSELSNTRRIIEEVVQSAKPVRCLETNIYAKATEQASDLEELSRVTAPFDYLLRKVAPKLVIAHGEDAAVYLQGQDLRCELMCVSHFARGWSFQRARELGLRIRRYCEGEYRDRA